ncbi:sugar transporter [Chitinimonas arctica]|uniref:Sugar transporter n=1 Tax=Chitinimonas arctica TaxID=2594795 RepID=A0A516SC53_9NEIS|nr:polysaccharide biosynthesis/export family protein [Chitinimonas arctica]QDQ25731.1 sugar transporter [Chitinimonas arctica]
MTLTKNALCSWASRFVSLLAVCVSFAVSADDIDLAADPAMREQRLGIVGKSFGQESSARPTIDIQGAGNDPMRGTRTNKGAQRPLGDALGGDEQRMGQPIRQQLPEQTEFQRFVYDSTGKLLPLFGYQLFRNSPDTFAPVDNVPVTSDYTIGPGDEIWIRAWGQIDIDIRAVVDRNGTVNIPRVGVFNVAGIRYQELQGYLSTAFSRTFKNFELSVTLGQLRSIQVFVVGQAQRPGVYTVSSLSTLVNAIFAAGGPSTRGSMRKIQLKRGDKVISEMDLYDLLLRGDKTKDRPLLPGDVIYIPPVGKVAAISGSINTAGIYELPEGEASLKDLIAWSGGLSSLADGLKVTIERIDNRKTRKVEELKLDAAGQSGAVKDGDVVTVYPIAPKFANSITLRGFVNQPERFTWRKGIRISDIVPSMESLISRSYWTDRNRMDAQDDSVDAQNAMVQAMYRGGGKITPRNGPRKINGINPPNRNFTPLQGVDPKDENAFASIQRAEAVNLDYAVIERVADDGSSDLLPFSLGLALKGDVQHNLLLQPNDVVTIFSKDDIRVPVEKQSKYIRLEGEFVTPGIYKLEQGETLQKLVTRIGGLTSNAYLFGTEFSRESVRVLQQKQLDDSVDRLERDLERTAVNKSQKAMNAEEAQSAKVEAEQQRGLLNKLRQIKATGRVSLEMPAELLPPDVKQLPDIALEDGDKIVIPNASGSISVFGAVFNPGAFIFKSEKRFEDYLRQSGGPTRDADESSMFVLRADGTVLSKRQSGWLSSLGGQKLMPGDAIVMPERLEERFNLTKELKDWSQIFFQFATGVAGLKVLKGL